MGERKLPPTIGWMTQTGSTAKKSDGHQTGSTAKQK
jgi:hypothetical protein